MLPERFLSMAMAEVLWFHVDEPLHSQGPVLHFSPLTLFLLLNEPHSSVQPRHAGPCSS